MEEPNVLLLVFVSVVAALGLVLLFAVVRLDVASRQASRQLRESGTDTSRVMERWPADCAVGAPRTLPPQTNGP